MSIEVTMKYKKSTPGTHVFKQVMEKEHELEYIPSLYIKKIAFTEPAQKIRVTVEVIK